MKTKKFDWWGLVKALIGAALGYIAGGGVS